MTVLVGIVCSDGVVIGCDSAELAGRSGQYTIERQEGVFKTEIIGNDVITAYTGATGLAQRINERITSTLEMLKAPFAGPVVMTGIGLRADPIQQFLIDRFKKGQVPYGALKAVEVAVILAQAVINDFHRTLSAQQQQPAVGWGLGALLGFIKDNEPELIEFDPVQFHPQLKGQPDSERGDKDRNWRAVSMGAGKQLADAFLAHSYRLLFGDRVPTIERAKLVIAWTIDHVRRYNAGWVGGPTHLVVLRMVDGKGHAQHESVDETHQQMVALEEYITAFRVQQNTADKGALDLNKALDLPKDQPEKKP